MASKTRQNKKETGSEIHDAPDQQVSAALLTQLLEEHRSAICADHRLALATLENKLDQLQSKVSDHDQKISSLEASANAVDERIQVLEAVCTELKEAKAKLQAKVTDLESRSRRNNIRIIGVPESLEGSRPTAFFSDLLSEVFGGILSSPPEVDRAHRSLANKPQQGGRPRAVIVRLHYFQVKENIIREARSRRGNLQYRGNSIAIYEDYTPEVLEQRVSYRDVLRRLYESGHKPTLRFPARLFISLPGGGKKRLNSVAEAENFLKSVQTDSSQHNG